MASMVQSHNNCSLYLYPEVSEFDAGKLDSLISTLRSIELMAQPVEQQENHYFPGNKYLEHIAYMGCAPNIQFEPSATSEKFCCIKIHHHEPAKLIHSQVQAKAPLCPCCQKPVKNWQPDKTETSILCDLCETRSNIEDFNWRKMAGYSQLFIEITDIFPKEAIPQQSLLDQLSDHTGMRWQYFYSCH